MDTGAKRFSTDDGPAIGLGRMTFRFKMTAEDTLGAYSLMEAVMPADSGSGLHRHWSYDEAAFVIMGRFECQTDGKAATLGAGESIYWPRGTTHKIKSVGPDEGRVLFVSSPGQIFEDFVKEIVNARVATGSAVSGPALDLRALAAKHGIEFFD